MVCANQRYQPWYSMQHTIWHLGGLDTDSIRVYGDDGG